MFVGFDPKQQAKHEQCLIDRFGEGLQEGIPRSKQNVKHWTEANWKTSGAAFAGICKDLVVLMERHFSSNSPEAQEVVRRHYEWLMQFWTPTPESYAGHTQMIVDPDLRKASEVYHVQLPEFMSVGIKAFAQRELS